MCLLQVPEGVPSGPVPSVLAAQVPAAQALHLLQLALSGNPTPPPPLNPLFTFFFSESETKTASEEEGPDIQLQRRHILREV